MSYVYVRDAKNKVHAFGPDDEIPDWAVPLITNKRGVQREDAKPETPLSTGSKPTPPPMHGTGSGRDAWAKYLHTVMPDMEAAPDDSRADIIKFISDAGFPTE
jgi:hypothetical protein